MLEPEKLLKDLDLNRMTATELVLVIRGLARKTQADDSPDNLNQLLGAIAFLAEIVESRLEEGVERVRVGETIAKGRASALPGTAEMEDAQDVSRSKASPSPEESDDKVAGDTKKLGPRFP